MIDSKTTFNLDLLHASVYFVGACIGIIVVTCTALILNALNVVVEPPYNILSNIILLIITFMLVIAILLFYGSSIKWALHKFRKTTPTKPIEN